MKQVYVLGPRGMLGEMVVRHFSNRSDFKVVPINDRFSLENLPGYFRRFEAQEPAVFINGIGGIPQKVKERQDFILPNILLPLELARSLAPHHQLIHPSTDCVFSGALAKPYSSSDEPDGEDIYGWSKMIAERALNDRPNTIVIRSSIIGLNRDSNNGLLEWFLAQPKNAVINGFTNHLWNGMTTKQWCVEVEKLILKKSMGENHLIQYAWKEGCSKYEMLKMFSQLFRPDLSISPVEHEKSIDRRLIPDVEVPNLRMQLNELQTDLIYD